MRFDSSFIVEPHLMTIQLFGFGFLLYCRGAFMPEMVRMIERTILPLPVFPGWRFAVVTPWN